MLRSGFRTGDNAPMAVLEFVDRYTPHHPRCACLRAAVLATTPDHIVARVPFCVSAALLHGTGRGRCGQHGQLVRTWARAWLRM